jgi:flagella basal body P-ring formation protein FlgA
MLGCFTGVCGAAELTIALPSIIEARRGDFFLGEYALFDGDQRLADSASMVRIAPEGGAFSRDDVITALGASAVAGRSVALRMAETVTVLPESRVAAELRAISGWKWRIDADGPAIDDATDFSLPPRVAPGARGVTAKIADNSGTRGNRQVKLKWYQPVVYSTEPLARGGRIDASSLSMRIETIGMNEDNVWDISQLRGAVPRQAIAAMRAISAGDLERVNAVRNGSSVTLIASVNGLGVEVRGIALQRGGIGDVIKVRNLSSKKVLEGTVIDVGRVQLN